MTTITQEGNTGTFVVRSTDLRYPQGFRYIEDAVRYCRGLGLPYHMS